MDFFTLISCSQNYYPPRKEGVQLGKDTTSNLKPDDISLVIALKPSVRGLNERLHRGIRSVP